MSQPTIEQALFSTGVLLDLDIGRWTGIKKLRDSDMLLPHIDPNAIYLGHKKLIPKHSTEKLLYIEGKARATLSKYSLDFPIAGARFVTYQTVDALLEQLQKLKKEHEDEVEIFLKEYPQLKEQQIQLLNIQYDCLAKEELKKSSENQMENRWKELSEWIQQQEDANRALYPTVELLRQKYRFKWRTFKISAAESTPGVNLGPNTLEDDLKAWVKFATTEFHRQLGEAAANAKAVLEKHGKLMPKNLKPLFDSFETFRAVNFVGCSNAQEAIDTIKKACGVKGDQLPPDTFLDNLNSSDWAKQDFSKLLDTVGKMAVEEIAEKTALESLTNSPSGVFARVLDLE